MKAFDQVLDDLDLVVFSDFNYGCLPQTLVDKIISKCKKYGKLVFADSQSSSQVGDICRFKKMDFILSNVKVIYHL